MVDFVTAVKYNLPVVARIIHEYIKQYIKQKPLM